jgi:hypothetical protein
MFRRAYLASWSVQRCGSKSTGASPSARAVLACWTPLPKKALSRQPRGGSGGRIAMRGVTSVAPRPYSACDFWRLLMAEAVTAGQRSRLTPVHSSRASGRIRRGPRSTGRQPSSSRPLLARYWETAQPIGPVPGELQKCSTILAIRQSYLAAHNNWQSLPIMVRLVRKPPYQGEAPPCLLGMSI